MRSRRFTIRAFIAGVLSVKDRALDVRLWQEALERRGLTPRSPAAVCERGDEATRSNVKKHPGGRVERKVRLGAVCHRFSPRELARSGLIVTLSCALLIASRVERVLLVSYPSKIVRLLSVSGSKLLSAGV